MKPLLDALDTKDAKFRIELQPLTSIHLYSDLQAELSPNGSITNVYIFSGIGLLVLLIAAINYMNLSTARASVRIKEVGIRKIAGSGKTGLIRMFLVETVLLTSIASVISVIIIYCLLPLFNELTDKNISIWHFGAFRTLGILTIFSVLTGLASGLYPAFFLSGFRLLPASKGQMGKHSGNIVFRKTLVTFQFFITILMISGSLIVYQQLGYVSKKDLGFKQNQILAFQLENGTSKRVEVLKEELSRDPLIERVASSRYPVGNNFFNMGVYNVETGGVMENKS